MPNELDLMVRILVAALLGAAIGLERELTGQNAGLRTHITISLGAALFAIGSAYSFTEFIQPRADTNYQVDVSRVASNIVTGVGFLGGGAIIKHGASVSGLTTAASMWVTAAVGMVVGLGGFFSATATTVALLFVLVGLRGPRRWIQQRSSALGSVAIELEPGADAGAIINELLSMPGVTVRSVSVHEGDQKQRLVRAEIKGENLPARLAEMLQREDVSDIDIGD